LKWNVFEQSHRLFSEKEHLVMIFKYSQFLMCGAAAGFCAGILFAPAKGTDSRKLIKKKAEAGKNAITDTAADATRQLSCVISNGNAALRKGKSSARKVIHRAGRVLLAT
jgi:gas vesicle protein